MGQILGGDGSYICQCGCHYEGMGGSSTGNNDSANDAGNLHSDDCTQPEPEQGSICYIEPERQDALCCMTQYTCLQILGYPEFSGQPYDTIH